MSREIEAFVIDWEREFATTSRVMGNLPPTELGFRPHPKSMTAGALAWHFADAEQFFVSAYLAGRAPERRDSEPPSTLQRLLQEFSLRHQALAQQVRSAPEGHWARSVAFGGTQSFPGGFLLGTVFLRHMVHHRGQLTVYLRLLSAKVPSIYGPSADDRGA